jgi:hypothetical protein
MSYRVKSSGFDVLFRRVLGGRHMSNNRQAASSTPKVDSKQRPVGDGKLVVSTSGSVFRGTRDVMFAPLSLNGVKIQTTKK